MNEVRHRFWDPRAEGLPPYRTEHRVIRTTRCGEFVDYFGLEKYIGRAWAKKFAYPTIEEAWESYKRRKARQITILRARLNRAESAAQWSFEDAVKNPLGGYTSLADDFEVIAS